MPNIKKYFLVIIFFISTFSNLKSQSDDFNNFANEFIKNAPVSKQFFIDNCEDYLMYDEIELNIIRKDTPSIEYWWFKGYFENSIFKIGNNVISVYSIETNNKKLLSVLKNMDPKNLRFDENDNLIGYVDDNGNFVSLYRPNENEGFVEIWQMDLKFHKDANNKWKLYFFTTFGE